MGDRPPSLDFRIFVKNVINYTVNVVNFIEIYYTKFMKNVFPFIFYSFM